MPPTARYLQGSGRRKPGAWARPVADAILFPLGYSQPGTVYPYGLWAFNEGAGARANGGFYGNLPATLQNGAGAYPTWATGAFRGPAINFGGSAYMDIGSGSFNIQATNNIAMVAWVKTSSTGNYSIVSKRNATIGAGWEWQMDNGIMYFFFNDINGNNYFGAYGNTAVNDGKWHQIAFTYNGNGSSSGIMTYLDGVANGNNAYALGTGNPGTQADTDLCFGCRLNNNSPDLLYAGLIDHILIVQSGPWVAADVAKLYIEPFRMFAQPGPRRFFYGRPQFPLTRRRKRPADWRAKPATKRKRPRSPLPAIPLLPTSLQKRKKRKPAVRAFKRKRTPMPREGLDLHPVPARLLAKRPTRKQPRRSRRHRQPLIPPPTGGCPTVTITEAMSATALVIEALTATGLAAESLSATSSAYEAMIASSLTDEYCSATARVVPCVKG
jgi:Concanavalin A-like lectin/glucanases superfamily